jgi:hypothetical protein
MGTEAHNIIIIDPTTAYESDEESFYVGTSVSDKVGSIEDNAGFSKPVRSQDGGDYSCSDFPSMDCDEDEVMDGRDDDVSCHHFDQNMPPT